MYLATVRVQSDSEEQVASKCTDAARRASDATAMQKGAPGPVEHLSRRTLED